MIGDIMNDDICTMNRYIMIYYDLLYHPHHITPYPHTIASHHIIYMLHNRHTYCTQSCIDRS